MKKSNVLSAILVSALIFTGCEKEENITPGSYEQLASATKQKEISNKAYGASSGKCMVLDAGPQQDSCLDGDGNCQMVEIEAVAVNGLTEAIDDGNTTNYLSSSIIATLSNGDQEISDLLTKVAAEDKKIVEAYLPNVIGVRKGFLIGDIESTL